MIYKSYIVEQNISGLEKNIFFYGENLGLKNDFKKIKKLDKNLISYSQEEILKDKENFTETYLIFHYLLITKVFILIM